MKVVMFKGDAYLFGGESLDEEGFIATREQFESGTCSFAHYFPDRGIIRFHEKLGDRKDLKIVRSEDVKLCVGEAIEILLNIVAHPSWNGPSGGR